MISQTVSVSRFFRSAAPKTLLGGRYKVIEQLGAGGFSQTFLAEDLHMPGHPRCVIKRLRPQVSSARTLQTAKRLFDTEAKVLYLLGDHDQIPRLLAHFEHAQEFYLAQELVVGEPLTQELREGQPWQEAQVIALLHDILTVLAFVHQQHVIHRDIKPANLMRRHRDARIVLIDFGAVKQASTQLGDPEKPTRTISIGTRGYMPNEQLVGNPRFSSDVYAVGMVGIQALTGVAPKDLKQDSRTGEIQWRHLAPQSNAALATVLDRMIRYDFRARYATAAEALEAIAPLSALSLDSLDSPNPQAAALATSMSSPAHQFTAQPVAQPDGTTLPWQQPTVADASSAVAANSHSARLSGQPDAFLETTQVTDVPAEPDWVSLPQSMASGVADEQAPTQAPTQAISPRYTDPTVLPELSGRSVLSFKQFSSILLRIVVPMVGCVAVGGLFLARQLELPSATPVVPTIYSASPGAPALPEGANETANVLAQANDLRQKQQFQQALALYNKAIALDPKSPVAEWGRCYSLNQLQQPADAIAACDAALKLKPNYPEALWSKGYALDQQQQHNEALALYERAIALRPNFAEAWSNKGASLLWLGRPDDALSALNKAISLNPKLAEAWNNRGAVLWSLHRFDEAIASVDQALTLNPNYKDARNLRQQMRQRSGK